MQENRVPSSPEDLVRLSTAASLFTYSSPVSQQELLAGRSDQILNAINAIAQVGQHVILYGERGVGKTSLSKVILTIASTYFDVPSSEAVIINCEANDHFVDIWKRIFREIPSLRAVDIDLDDLSPDYIRFVLKNHLPGKAVVVIDEFDRMTNAPSRDLFADTIKALSDHAIDITLVFVGVADSVSELIQEHTSISRCLFQIQLPRMTLAELQQIIDMRLQKLNITIHSEVRDFIAFVSQGFPFYTHLIGLHATQAAILAGVKTIEFTYLTPAIGRAIRVNEYGLLRSYTAATSNARQTNYKKVLLACALARPDELGFFAAVDLRTTFSAVTGKPCTTSNYSRNLTELCSPEKGSILTVKGKSRSLRYRFTDAIMQPYVVINSLASGDIDKDTLLSLWPFNT
jgi:energy-coupling factor transporter ATP-binding protein EcfA2